MTTPTREERIVIDEQKWLQDYYGIYKRIVSDESVFPSLASLYNLALSLRENGGKFIIAGNGASASIASHAAVDLSKQGKVRAINFNEANLITCLSNDYGYENWIARGIDLYADKGDAVILISVSGTSPNVVAAARHANSLGMPTITFTGKAIDNALKAEGTINFWVDSNAYNIVESVHMMWLTTVVDMLVGSSEYSVT